MQENSIWRMTYAGSPLVFSLDEVLPGQGLLAPGGASQLGDRIYYLSQNGFAVVENGSTSTPIGAQKIDRTVLLDLDTGYLDRVKSVVDVLNRHVYWLYPGSGNVSGTPNKVVIFDWSVGRWSYAEVTAHHLFISAPPGYTLDGLDSVSTNLDSFSTSFDDRVWQGGAGQIGVFDSDFKLAFFTGDPMPAIIETTEIAAGKNRRFLLNSVRPLVDGGSQNIQVGSRQLQTDTETWSATATVNSNGRATLRKNARYHRIRVNLSGSWTHAQGVEITGAPVGWR
jgi:hypothetical protein